MQQTSSTNVRVITAPPLVFGLIATVALRDANT
jgi:hypothetical protein